MKRLKIWVIAPTLWEIDMLLSFKNDDEPFEVFRDIIERFQRQAASQARIA